MVNRTDREFWKVLAYSIVALVAWSVLLYMAFYYGGDPR
jgi:hypothetical protein